MKSLRVLPLLAMLAMLAPARGDAAQQPAAGTGAIEVSTRVTPTGGRGEPARALPLYLLRKSFEDIRKEAEETEPHADLASFIEALEVSKELKEWMTRRGSVQLTGTEFVRSLTTADILDVPEFYNAYLERNTSEIALRVPRPRRTARDAQEAERQQEQFRQNVRKYIEANPLSREGMDIYLAEIDPGQRWARQAGLRRERVRRRALEQAESRYLAAHIETGLEGRASFTRIPAGDYWLSTLEAEAHAGDVRLRWDTPVRVRAGETTRIELSNLNAAPRESANR